MNKRVVYTAIYGKKDNLKDPLFISEGWDYICFTDDPHLDSSVWKVVYSEATHRDPVRSAKIFKVLPHNYLTKYDISVWIDANYIIKNDINTLIEKLGYLKERNLFTFQHDQGRNCIYDEAIVVKRDKKDNPLTIENQMLKYKKNKYPNQNGLTANSILIRRHNETDMIELSELWWKEIQEHSRRDQLSFCYCLWNLKTKYMMARYPSLDIRNNLWFQWVPHNYELQEWK